MKTILLALCLCVTSQAADLSLDPVQIVKAVKLSKGSRLHKWVYAAETVAAGMSLGFDGGTTEKLITVPGLKEGNAVFLIGTGTNQHFDQYKFWGYKISLAAFPFAATYVAHKIGGETTTSDIISISAAGATTALFTWAGIHNLDLIRGAQKTAPPYQIVD
jgi:hypothetical protein